MTYAEHVAAAAYEASLVGAIRLPADYLRQPLANRLAIAEQWYHDLMQRESNGDHQAVWLLRNFPNLRYRDRPSDFIPGQRRAGLPSACVIGPVAYVGGAERWAESLVRSTRERIDWRGFGVCDAQAVDPITLHAWRRLAPVARGRVNVRTLAGACDIVVAWGLGNLRWLIPPGRTIVSVSHSPGGSSWAKQLLSHGPDDADEWVAVSESALGPIPKPHQKGATIITNGVDPDRVRFRPELRRRRLELRARWGVRHGQIVVGMLGRCSEEKDVGAILRAIEALPRKYTGVVVGDSAMAEDLKAEAAVSGRVRFFPATDEVAAVLGSFDVLLGASHYESFWLTGVEAMLARRPIVSTRVGVLQEVPGLARIIPDAADGETIAAAILADQADEAGTAARVDFAERTALERWSMETFGRKWGDYLTSLVLR